MEKGKLEGKILFAFSDPGGAKPLLALAEQIDAAEIKIISDRRFPFFNDFKNNVEFVEDKFEQVVESFQPDIIFTGTSWPALIEKKFIQIAAQKKIPCFSFIDHWTRMEDRFRLDEKTLLQPDQIWVIDERAKKIAIESGLKKESIVVVGNPYHQWLANWLPQQTKEAFLQQIGIGEEQKKLLLFAPDPLSNINGMEKYGFDEATALQDLVDIFKLHPSLENKWLVLIKPHPNQQRKVLQDLIPLNDSFILLPENADTNTAIFYSDIIVGFFSSLLIEAKVLKKKIIRFLPVALNEDPLATSDVGSMVNKQQLTHLLSQ